MIIIRIFTYIWSIRTGEPYKSLSLGGKYTIKSGMLCSFTHLIQIEILTNKRTANKNTLIMKKKKTTASKYKVRGEKITLNLPGEDAGCQRVFQTI